MMQQTPAIPDVCQWALFLRNHDELTLEMVTDEERDYMYLAYSLDPQARINLGIRRRLAPLVGNNRRRIELLNSLLFSFPGTPIIYYGDEIGMGDNLYLGDSNGVRTPMQWTSDRNARFSRADPARLYSPVIMDPVYGYQGRQRRGTGARRLVAAPVDAEHDSVAEAVYGVRRRQHAVSRARQPQGARLRPANMENDVILCVANLSRSVQPAELDLAPLPDCSGRGAWLHGVSDHWRAPYFLTLGPYGFYWFELQRRDL